MKRRCLLCGYEWESRKSTKPKQCPRCKRYDWDKIKKGDKE